jgi:hypothetical protein
MKHEYRFLMLTAILIIVLCCPVSAGKEIPVISEIDKMASLGETADDSLGESIVDGIEKNPQKVSGTLVLKLKQKNLTEQQEMVYVWALGLTGVPEAVSVIKTLYNQSKSESVKFNCMQALANIGGKQSGEFLLSVLDKTTDKEKRFDILNFLAQMQYEAALPKTEEILKQDPKNFYWQTIFVFGKMGDAGIPFLLKHINTQDENVRANTVVALGQWLIPTEAARPLLDQYWVENDVDIRGIILSSLERTIPDMTEMKGVFEQVASREKNEKLKTYANETLSNLGSMKTDIKTFSSKKVISETSFESEFKQLFKSAGKKGSYETLGNASSVKDEARLKKLRERILQRNSDEAFYDYREVNQIIIRNRMINAVVRQGAAK